MASNRNTSRKPRRRNWASEVARKQHSTVRRQLARAAAERSTREAEYARTSLRNAATRMEQKEINKRVNSISSGLRPRLTAVMNSWGLNLPVEIGTSSSLSAWTDFQVIHIDYNTDKASKASVARVNQVSITEVPMRPEDQRRIAAEIRGLFYHEVGHNLATVPLPELLALAAREGWAPSTQSVSAGADPTNSADWSISQDFRHGWNALEDQRMEAWLVAESPQIAAYITVVVLERMMSNSVVNNSWPLVAGRKYLPARVRERSRRLFSHSSITAEQVESIVDAYRTATTATEMITAVERYVAMLPDLAREGYNPITTIDSHRLGPGRVPEGERQDIEGRIRTTGEKIAQDQAEQADETASDETAKSPSTPSDESSDPGRGRGGRSDDNGDDSDDSHDGDEDDAWGGTGAGRGSTYRTGDETPRPTSRRDMEDAMDSVMEDLADDQTLTEDVSAINDAYATDEGALPAYNGQHENTDEQVVAQARVIVDDIVRAFELVTADCAPSWQTQQRRGVLEAVRYHTRQPGDLEIFRSYSDHGDPGHDIAVSLFLDISGSMSGTDDVLGATAWSVKAACDALGIECDVTLFDHIGYTLWGVNDVAPSVVPSLAAQGGTDPTGAFAAMLEEERPQKHHLVLVMTDGAWSDPLSLVPYQHPNVYSMLFYYAPHMYGEPGPNPILATRHSVNEAYSIEDLSAIPQALEHLLMSLA